LENITSKLFLKKLACLVYNGLLKEANFLRINLDVIFPGTVRSLRKRAPTGKRGAMQFDLIGIMPAVQLS
jgi:hypothetical protein